MIDVLCRVVTIIVLCLLLLYISGRVGVRIQQRKREKRNKQLTKEFILQFLASRKDEYGTTRVMIEQALFGRRPTIPSSISYCPEILQKLAMADVITIRPVTVDEVIRLEGFVERYGAYARHFAEASQALGQIFGGPPNCLIRLTQQGRSFVKQAVG